MLFGDLLLNFFRLIFPKAPTWVGRLISIAVPAVIELVRELATRDMAGEDKFDLAVREVGDLLDDAFDDIPEWSGLTEVQRDKILGGLVELAVFLEGLADSPNSDKKLRQARRALRSVRRG